MRCVSALHFEPKGKEHHMSRLEAIAAGLYYPTPEPVVATLARFITLPATGTVRLLDPCAGKGRALALLADAIHRQQHDERWHLGGKGIAPPPTVELYGIEPNLERARDATERIPNLLVTSYFTATLSEGGFQLAFVNPPYDTDSAGDGGAGGRGPSGSAGKNERLEIRFLRRTTNKLAADGVLIWIVPQVRLREAAKHLVEHYRDLACWRFPDVPWRPPDAPDRPLVPMYAAFSQVVLLGRRRRVPVPADATTLTHVERWATMGADLAPLPIESGGSNQGHPVDAASIEAAGAAGRAGLSNHAAVQREQAAGSPAWPKWPAAAPRQSAENAENEDADNPRFVLPAALTSLRYFLATTFDPDAVAAQLNRPGVGVWSERGYIERHWPDPDTADLGIGLPLAPLRRGHLALLAAAGIANGQELVGTDGRRLVVTGACRKVTVRQESEERDPTSGERVTITTETERFEVALWAIDLESGDVIHIV